METRRSFIRNVAIGAAGLSLGNQVFGMPFKGSILKGERQGEGRGRWFFRPV